MNYERQHGPYWIDTSGLAEGNRSPELRMAVVACPPGGDRMGVYLDWLREEKIHVLISLLQPDETRPWDWSRRVRSAGESGCHSVGCL